MDQQDNLLSALLAIVTNPEMVARNIQKLQTDKAEVNGLLEKADEAQKHADETLAQAKALHEKTNAFHATVSTREKALKNNEDYWLQKDTEQKEVEKKLHQQEVDNADKARHLSEREEVVKKLESAIEARKKEADALHAKATEHEETAASLKREHEEALEKLRAFTGGIAKK